MNKYYPILQCHVMVARIAGAVTRASAPIATSADWIRLGNATSGGVSVATETKERTSIVVGQRVKIKAVVSREISAKATIEELNKAVVDAIFGSATTATDDFISHGAGFTYWVRFQSYDQDDTNRILLEGLADISPSGDIPLGGDEFFKADFDFAFQGRVAGKLIGAYPV